MNVHVEISHERNEDIDLRLQHPSGLSIGLSSDNGGTGQGYDATFDDEAPSNVVDAPQPASIVGSWQPEQPLSTFDGLQAEGTWTLRVRDDANVTDEGYLENWTLTVKTEGLGEVEACPAISCQEVYTHDPSAPSGDYWLEELSGGLEPYWCHMDDGGGWTRVYWFDRPGEGHGIPEFEAGFTGSLSNNMGFYDVSADAIVLRDNNGNADRLWGTTFIDIDNAGEFGHDVELEGTSMEGSGIWLAAHGEDSALAELTCGSGSNLHLANPSYGIAQLLGVPFVCSGSTSFSIAPGFSTGDLGEPMEEFELYSLMSDSGDDELEVGRVEVFVR